MYLQLIITLLLALFVVCIVYKQFQAQDGFGKLHVPCTIQYICDDKDVVYAERLVAAIEKERQANEIEKRRREYREWMENCNRLFGKESNESHERKVDLRVIDGAA